MKNVAKRKKTIRLLQICFIYYLFRKIKYIKVYISNNFQNHAMIIKNYSVNVK